MPTSATNINELLNSAGISEEILRYNSEIIDTVTQNGGETIYSYNNVMIVSNISDELYNELLKDDKISFIQDLPLKQYGEIDFDLINQIDISTIENYIEDVNLETTTVSTGTTTDVEYGAAKKVTISGETIKITNNVFSISALTNEWFSYEILSEGIKPINFSVTKPTNYTGELSIVDGKILSGMTTEGGIYNIIIKGTNSLGTDTKNITLSIYDPIRITNTNLEVYCKAGVTFNYTIECDGSSPKTYNITGLPSGLTFQDGIITGILYSGGTYNVTIEVSNAISSDSVILKITVAGAPIITSESYVTATQYSGFTYDITSEYQSITTFKIIGLLPEGLSFKVATISGIPIKPGSYDLMIYATNPIATKTMSLTIFVESVEI